ncbi:hypothetical protein GJ744_005521 [Endocarpon pusillum]|uniref:BZIP domain-containing protein n=1 Tax=Endocarpon pusillum TaxID=364733 RepID=A0A8H7AKU1_9EURO|nr:hypothetical protein GJ744_005521 [Endocarpon pusillum]
MPARASFDTTSSASTNSGKSDLKREDCIERPSKTLRRPRGRPPLHPSPTTSQNLQDGSTLKRTWKGNNAQCSPSELREQHLQRNRVAASKYRQKHKSWSDALAERCQAEAKKREFLQDLTRSLREEVLSLKEQAMYQSGCDCMIMKLYLGRQTVDLLGLPDRSPMSSLATISQDSISATSSSFDSWSVDDNFFSNSI